MMRGRRLTAFSAHDVFYRRRLLWFLCPGFCVEFLYLPIFGMHEVSIFLNLRQLEVALFWGIKLRDQAKSSFTW